MPARVLRLAPGADELEARFRANREALGITEAFPPAVQAEADELSTRPQLPAEDRTDLALVTLDPVGSMDLDQAFALERRPDGGFRVRYAIADVAAWVPAGSAVDAEAHARVVTAYSPDRRAPLHPPVLSEGAASLLPDGPRPAVLWTLDVDAGGELVQVDVRRAMVRSRGRLDYASVQQAIDDHTADPMVALLAEVGPLLQRAEEARGGVSLNAPVQEVVRRDGTYQLVYAAPHAVEGWNAQLSLLCGRAAARMMLDGRIGILRTLPPADPASVRRLRGVARALHLDWAPTEPYAELLRRLDARHVPAHAAFLDEAASLFRGAGYAAFTGDPPALHEHAAIAAPYAHCTAPLRRLVDRYASEICVALAAGEEVPEWARAALPDLPEEMEHGSRRAGQLERANVDTMEAAALSVHLGQNFRAVVVDIWKGDRGEVMIDDPAVSAPCSGPLELGEVLTVKLEEADVASGKVAFSPVR